MRKEAVSLPRSWRWKWISGNRIAQGNTQECAGRKSQGAAESLALPMGRATPRPKTSIGQPLGRSMANPTLTTVRAQRLRPAACMMLVMESASSGLCRKIAKNTPNPAQPIPSSYAHPTRMLARPARFPLSPCAGPMPSGNADPTHRMHIRAAIALLTAEVVLVKVEETQQQQHQNETQHHPPHGCLDRVLAGNSRQAVGQKMVKGNAENSDPRRGLITSACGVCVMVTMPGNHPPSKDAATMATEYPDNSNKAFASIIA